MGEVKLNSVRISRVMSDHVAKRVLADFVSDTPKIKGLTKEFDKALEKEAHYQATIVAPKLDVLLKKHYKETFDVATSILNDGILQNAALDLGVISPNKIQTKFTPLTKAYVLRKARTHPGTDKLFWKYTGKLYKAMRAFANNRKTAVNWSKTGVTFLSRGKIYHGRRFRFQYDFHLPEIKNSQFLDNVFRRAYLTGANSGRYGAYNKMGFGSATAVKRSDPLSYLQINETEGLTRKDGRSRSRPFLTELAAKRGMQVQTILLRGVQKLS